jgi:hypothetical protein
MREQMSFLLLKELNLADFYNKKDQNQICLLQVEEE